MFIKLVIILLSFLLTKVIVGPHLTSAAITYYMSPTSQSCPQVSDPYHSLDEYVANSSMFFSSDKANIVLIFVNGAHMSSGGKLAMIDLINLTMIGESRKVIIQSVEFGIDVETLQVSSILFSGSANVRVRPASWLQDFNTVQVVDCKFEEHSSLKTIESNLNLSNCEFLNVSLPPNNNPLTVYDNHKFIWMELSLSVPIRQLSWLFIVKFSLRIQWTSSTILEFQEELWFFSQLDCILEAPQMHLSSITVLWWCHYIY